MCSIQQLADSPTTIHDQEETLECFVDGLLDHDKEDFGRYCNYIQDKISPTCESA